MSFRSILLIISCFVPYVQLIGTIKGTIFKKMRTETILKIYNTLLLPTFLYGSENWTLTALQRRWIEAAEMKLLRPLGRLHPLWPQNKRLHTPRTTDYRHTRQDRWIQTELGFYTCEECQKNRIRLKSYHYRPRGRRTVGRSKKRWREQL